MKRIASGVFVLIALSVLAGCDKDVIYEPIEPYFDVISADGSETHQYTARVRAFARDRTLTASEVSASLIPNVEGQQISKDGLKEITDAEIHLTILASSVDAVKLGKGNLVEGDYTLLVDSRTRFLPYEEAVRRSRGKDDAGGGQRG